MKHINTTEKAELLARIISTLYRGGVSASEMIDAGIYRLVHENNARFLKEHDKWQRDISNLSR